VQPPLNHSDPQYALEVIAFATSLPYRDLEARLFGSDVAFLLLAFQSSDLSPLRFTYLDAPGALLMFV
jgi:hypothetical protein